MTGETWTLIALIVVSAAMGFLLSCYAASKSFARLRGAVTDLKDALDKSTATMKLAMAEIERQAEEIRKLDKENDALRSANVTGKSPALENRLAVAIAEWRGAIKPTPSSTNSRHVRRVSAFLALDAETRKKFIGEASRFLMNQETDERVRAAPAASPRRASAAHGGAVRPTVSRRIRSSSARFRTAPSMTAT